MQHKRHVTCPAPACYTSAHKDDDRRRAVFGVRLLRGVVFFDFARAARTPPALSAWLSITFGMALQAASQRARVPLVPQLCRAWRRLSAARTTHVTRSRGFDKQDPLSWGRSAESEADDASFSVSSDASYEKLQQLSDTELMTLLTQPQPQSMPASFSAAASPASAAEAIAAGISAFKAGDAAAALALWRDAESLPGSGPLRVRGKPRSLSEGELQATRYNAAAALTSMGQLDDALVALDSCLLEGYDDLAQLQRDADFTRLRAERGAEWAALTARLRRPPPSLFEQLFKL